MRGVAQHHVQDPRGYRAGGAAKVVDLRHAVEGAVCAALVFIGHESEKEEKRQSKQDRTQNFAKAVIRKLGHEVHGLYPRCLLHPI